MGRYGRGSRRSHGDRGKDSKEVARKPKPKPKPVPKLVFGKYLVVGVLGSGSFGKIYQGVHQDTGLEVAIKMEASSSNLPQMFNEVEVYYGLNSKVANGFSEIYDHGTESGYNIMIMQKLGPDLESMFDKCNNRFTLKTVLMLGLQMLHRLQYMHWKGFVHRDIKPTNFLMGIGNEAKYVYLIDFGFSKRYVNPTDNVHIPWFDRCPLIGTARYSSVNSHLGIEPSRRDDLESLGYCLLYMLKGNLPWQGLRTRTKQKLNSVIRDRKEKVSIESLCQDTPNEFSLYISYCRRLEFAEDPNYDYLRSLLSDMFHKAGYQYDHKYDWG